jgi:hypothetical protein
MAAMPPIPTSAPGLTRRGLLAGSAGLALLVAGCTSSSGARQDAVATSRQADALAGQVRVQEALVAAYAAAGAGSAALASRLPDLVAQAKQQLTRLKAAAPGTGASRSAASSSSGSSSSSAAPAVPAGQDPTTWLRAQITAAADSHTAACLAQTGARAALLGSVAAGLRGQVGALS